MARAERPVVSAEDFIGAVRTYADRVHDDVRRLGCTPAEAAEVVESSALDLLESAATAPESVTDLVGAWFRAARLLAERLVGGASRTAPAPEESSAALLSVSEDDLLVRDTLAGLEPRDRSALLLRDAYDLSYTSTSVALGLVEAEGAAAVVARARLRFAIAAEPDGSSVPTGHTGDLASLGRFVDGRLPPERERALRRHLDTCRICQLAEPRLRETRSRVAGLALAALPDTERDAVLAHVGTAARKLLPTKASLARRTADPAPPLMRPALVAACLGGAILLGSLVGAVTADNPSTTSGTGIGPGPGPDGKPRPTSGTGTATAPGTALGTSRSAPPTTPQTTSLTTSAPTTTPPTSATTTPPATGPAAMTLDPSSGPNRTLVTIAGTGWTPGRTVTLRYLNPLGNETGSTGSARIDEKGAFVTTLEANDPLGVPGPHRVEATDGRSTVSRTFSAT